MSPSRIRIRLVTLGTSRYSAWPFFQSLHTFLLTPVNKKFLLGLLALAAAHSSAEAQSRRPRLTLPAGKIFNAPVRRPVMLTAPDAPGPVRQAVPARSPQAPNPASFGQLIGQTTYDLQTNRATANRMAMTGTALSAVWTQTCNLSGGTWANRGAGYNFAADANATAVPSVPFANGTTGNCPTSFGLTSMRTGWPEVVHSNGNEVVFAHSGTSTVMTRRTAGSGAWLNPSTVLPFSQNIDGPGSAANGTWPRAVAGAANTIHLIYTSSISGNVDQAQNPVGNPATTQQAGIVGPVVYSRSQDGGLTWDLQNQVPPMFTREFIGNGTNTDTISIGGDSYAIAANGQNVAISAGSFGDNTMLATSSDNGSTWTSMRIAGPFTDADTIGVQTANGRTPAILASDGSMALVIDNAGTTHWFSGSQLMEVRRLASGNWVPTGSYFPDALPAMLYWNNRELMRNKPEIIIELDSLCPSTPAFTPCGLARADGTVQSRQPYNVTGPISMPTAAVDANGDVYVIYAAGRLGTSNTGAEDGQYLRDLYLNKLTFPGNMMVNVGVQKNISRDIYNIADGAAAANNEESVYPSAVHMIMGGKMHYQFMSDFEPGNALQPTGAADPEVENAVMYDNITVANHTFPVGLTITGVTGTREDAANYVAGVSAAPNPTTGRTTLHLNLKQNATAAIVVRNVLGQEVLRVPVSALNAGQNTVDLDLSNQASGVYFYTVAADKFTLTQRVVKQ